MSDQPPTALHLLSDPADGIPHVITEESELLAAAEAIAGGEGSVALDAERASGYRYSQRAYLVQVRRDNAGSFLIDPIALPDLTPMNDAIGGAEWILHAATQDLACLAEVGLRPRQLFDTELAGRILGLPRVGLAAVVEHYLGVTLAKEHSAVDWTWRCRARPTGLARSSRRCSTGPRPSGPSRGGARPVWRRSSPGVGMPWCANSGRCGTASRESATSRRGGSPPTRS
jgi:ribonuclease D